DRVDRLAHPANVIARIAFVRVDDVDAEPVPLLHVDAARAVLVITGDDETSALGDDVGGDVERPPRADAFDDALGAAPVRQFANAIHDRLVIAHRNRFV